MNELEFDFHVNEFQLKQLAALSTSERQFEVKDLGEIKGWLNGKIDLFFEYEGKYYILDWKSNFLGDTVDYYNQEHLAKAMNENNYHLQYLIYSLAVKKYLSKRLPNFDYDTQFAGVLLFSRSFTRTMGQTSQKHWLSAGQFLSTPFLPSDPDGPTFTSSRPSPK